MQLECKIQILIHQLNLNLRFLKKHPEIKNNSLFAYTLVLLKKLPDEDSKKSLIQTAETLMDEYKDNVDMEWIGFPENYVKIMKNNL